MTKYMTKGNSANSVYLSEFVKKEVQKYLKGNTESLMTPKSPQIYTQSTAGHFSTRARQNLLKPLYPQVGNDAYNQHARR